MVSVCTRFVPLRKFFFVPIAHVTNRTEKMVKETRRAGDETCAKLPESPGEILAFRFLLYAKAKLASWCYAQINEGGLAG
jgi:hypothetical protein